MRGGAHQPTPEEINVISDIFDKSLSLKLLTFLTELYDKTFVNEMLLEGNVPGIDPVTWIRTKRALGYLLPAAQIATVGAVAVGTAVAASATPAGIIGAGVLGASTGAALPETGGALRRNIGPNVNTTTSRADLVFSENFARLLIAKFNVVNQPELLAAGVNEAPTYSSLCGAYISHCKDETKRKWDIRHKSFREMLSRSPPRESPAAVGGASGAGADSNPTRGDTVFLYPDPDAASIGGSE